MLLLRIYATELNSDAQCSLLGVNYEQQKKIARSPLDGQEKDFPYLTFLRSFRSMRRLWVENLFRPSDPEIVPLVLEPNLLSVEAAVARCLGLKLLV